MTVYTDSQLAVLTDTSVNNVDAAASVGVSEATVRRWRRKNGVKPEPRSVSGRVPPPAEQDGPTELELLAAENADLRRALRKDTRSSVGDERVLRAIEQAVGRVDPVRLPRVVPGPRTRDAEPHHRQVLLLSDIHYGEVIDGERMNGLNSYNCQIAAERLRAVQKAVLSFKRVRPEMTGLDIFMLGDNGSGDIHDLNETNEVPAAEQYVRCGYLLADLVCGLTPHYPEIRCTGVVGNHPRSKPQAVSNNSHDNGDWIGYQIAKAATDQFPNVDWTIPYGPQAVCEVGGLTFLLWHGDGVRSSMPGVPWGGVMRRWNELRNSYAAQGVKLDYLTVGHFHQACAVDKILMNGSLCGPNTYSLKNFGGGQRATQLLLTIDERRSRITDVSYITP